MSGTEGTIRVGIVVAPKAPRHAREGFPLFLKIINLKYKDNHEFVA